VASSSTQGSGHSIFAVSERSLVVRTLGINEVRPLSNFDELVTTVLSSDIPKFMYNNSPGGQTPPLLVGRRSNPGILPTARLFED
jgi:hypothetical protein